MLELVPIAAEEAAEASQTPFYVAGIVLAVWAVVLSVFGLRSTGFPSGAGAARGVMAISAVLVVATLSAAIVTSG